MEGVKLDCFLVIPCFHESERVPEFLNLLCAEIASSGLSVGVQLVDDGSGTREVEQLRKVTSRVRNVYPFVGEVFALKENGGKGLAIRSGWALAPDDCPLLGFVDADGSVAASEVVRVLRVALDLDEESLVMASRRAKGARVERSLFRKFLAGSFSLMTRVFYGIRILDTQCGCKFVSGPWYREQALAFSEDGFGLDLELILRARESGMSIREVGVAWKEVSGSKVGFESCWRLGKAVALRRIGG
ncbi:hypothetical protein VDG1235_539 [Verrucomicrobiia bacterium DG1235]|nr:hypothetical protein VDG1235_539 [Verrucomicrobiae bacterium DG1235]